MAEVILVAHVAVDHVGDGLEPAVRVRREAGDVVLRVVGAELVEQQKGIEPQCRGRAERTAQAHAGAIRGLGAEDDLVDDAGVHGRTPWTVPRR